MGDRSLIKVYMGKKNDPVYLYGHWQGNRNYKVVKTVLSRRERWDDEPYLCRMLFCEFVKGHETDSTGFGISTYIVDNEHTIIGVNCEKQMVTFETDDGTIKGSMTFKQMVDRKDKHSKTVKENLKY